MRIPLRGHRAARTCLIALVLTVGVTAPVVAPAAARLNTGPGPASTR